eukprot:COSAG02_NODE_4114_length_5756_cov_2.289376_1_plen_497_part_10
MLGLGEGFMDEQHAIQADELQRQYAAEDIKPPNMFISVEPVPVVADPADGPMSPDEFTSNNQTLYALEVRRISGKTWIRLINGWVCTVNSSGIEVVRSRGADTDISGSQQSGQSSTQYERRLAELLTINGNSQDASELCRQWAGREHVLVAHVEAKYRVNTIIEMLDQLPMRACVNRCFQFWLFEGEDVISELRKATELDLRALLHRNNSQKRSKLRYIEKRIRKRLLIRHILSCKYVRQLQENTIGITRNVASIAAHMVSTAELEEIAEVVREAHERVKAQDTQSLTGWILHWFGIRKTPSQDTKEGAVRQQGHDAYWELSPRADVDSWSPEEISNPLFTTPEDLKAQDSTELDTDATEESLSNFDFGIAAELDAIKGAAETLQQAKAQILTGTHTVSSLATLLVLGCMRARTREQLEHYIIPSVLLTAGACQIYDIAKTKKDAEGLLADAMMSVMLNHTVVATVERVPPPSSRKDRDTADNECLKISSVKRGIGS